MRERSLYVLALAFFLCHLQSLTARAAESEPETPAETGAEPGAQATPAPPAGPRHPRVLYISMKGCPACARELSRLRRPGGDFDGMRAKGWKIGPTPDCHLQVVDREQIPELVLQFGIQSYPAVICINQREIVRSFQSGCTTPLDAWTFGFLLNGKNERPAGSIPEAARVAWTGSYPLRGNHWSIEGDWNPTRERVVTHLRTTHGNQIAASYAIDAWSVEELKSLHDDLHEREIGAVSTSGYSYSGGYVQQPTRSTNFTSASHKMGF